MTRTMLPVQECCAVCRRPLSRCHHATGAGMRTYPGILVRGEWSHVPAPGLPLPVRASLRSGFDRPASWDTGIGKGVPDAR